MSVIIPRKAVNNLPYHGFNVYFRNFFGLFRFVIHVRIVSYIEVDENVYGMIITCLYRDF